MALSAAELDAVKAVDAAFAAGMNAKDTAAVFEVYAADAKVMPPVDMFSGIAPPAPAKRRSSSGWSDQFHLTGLP